MLIENKLAWIHDKKAVLHNDRLRWLEIIEMFYKQHEESDNPEDRAKLKEMMKFCGEQSQEIKTKLKQIK